jgi:hypothetical protein
MYMSNPESTTIAPFTVFVAERDDYGRSCHALRSYPAYRTLGYVVRLPKRAIECRTDGAKYFINDWTLNTRFPNGLEGENTAISYHRTLKLAKGALVASVQA